MSAGTSFIPLIVFWQALILTPLLSAASMRCFTLESPFNMKMPGPKATSSISTGSPPTPSRRFCMLLRMMFQRAGSLSVTWKTARFRTGADWALTLWTNAPDSDAAPAAKMNKRLEAWGMRCLLGKNEAVWNPDDHSNCSTVADTLPGACLLYTSDAADEEDSVDLGG